MSKGADKGSIKKAYFKLAKQYHPDQNKGDEAAAEKFKEVTDAYEVLKDDQKREMYNTFGHAGVDPNAAGGGPGGNPFGAGGFDFGDGSFHFSSSNMGGGMGGQQQVDPEELFEAIFGGGRPRGPRRGADLQMRARVTFREAVFGTSQDVNLRYRVNDRATGRSETKSRTVTVDVPAGVDDGATLRLAGQGSEGDPGAPSGDLLLHISVERDSRYERDGADVHTRVPVSLVQAVLGGTADVETLHGEVEVKIPKGCQVNAKLLLRGKGVPLVNDYAGRRGNHIVHLDVEIPKSVSARQEELLREFDEEAKRCGSGISGRLAAAAGSAFESIFGSSGDEKKEKDKDDADKSQSQVEEDKGEAEADEKKAV